MQWTESSGSVEKFPIHWFLVLEDYMPICELMPYMICLYLVQAGVVYL